MLGIGLITLFLPFGIYPDVRVSALCFFSTAVDAVLLLHHRTRAFSRSRWLNGMRVRSVATSRIAPSLTGWNLCSCLHVPVERPFYNKELSSVNEIAFTAGMLHSASFTDLGGRSFSGVWNVLAGYFSLRAFCNPLSRSA
jgi:hypothetical protein